MRYAVVTFGCRVNQADSFRLDEDLRRAGAEPARAEQADLVVVNSCSVTASAEQGTRQTVRRLARANPSARIVVTGCYATRAADEVAALPGVVRVVSNREKDDLFRRPDPLEGLIPARSADGEGPCGTVLGPGDNGRTALTLRVQTGCDQVCSYCIIPSTRGAGRSLPVAAVVAAAERAAAAGYREIVLTGVHLGSYGRDLLPAVGLADLLRALADSRAEVLFRVSSLEPMDCTPAVLEWLTAPASRFAPHFHLPLQHASDAVLSRMRRPYTSRAYQALIETVADRLPDAAIGTDLIVGFPGETDDEFAANLAYLPDSPLSHLHVFPYSDRPGTDASRLSGRVPGTVTRERAARLRAIGTALSRRFKARQVGTVRPGLTIDDGAVVVTDNYLKVRIAERRPRNERVRVRILEAGETVTGVVETGDQTRSSDASCCPGALVRPESVIS